MERRLVALQETVWHTLLTLEDSATLWLATEAEAQQARRSECRTRRLSGRRIAESVVGSASRPQGRWSPPLEGVEQTAMRCKPALPRGRSECTHSHARGIVVNGAMTRPAPARQEEAIPSRLKRLGMRPTGFSSKDTDAHRPSVHAQAREARPAQALTGTHALGACSRPGSPARDASTHSPCSVPTLRGREGLHDGGKNRRRLQTEGVGEVTSLTACASLPAAHHAGVASSVRPSVNSLLAWISLG